MKYMRPLFSLPASFLTLLALCGTLHAQNGTAPEPIDFRNPPRLLFDGTYTLNIPFVEVNGIPGAYQEARIEYAPATNTWRLAGYRKATPIADIKEVVPVVTRDKPVQVLLDIRGTFSNGCPQVGEAVIKQTGTLFTVYVFYRYGSAPRACIQMELPFRKVVPLPVYGLAAGSYRYEVNGNFSGTFTLTADNALDPLPEQLR